MAGCRESGLREVRRPREPFADGFRAPRLTHVGGRPPSGWEAPVAVAARVEAVVARHRDEARPLVLAGHGTASTTWLASRALIRDPVAFWRALRLPDVVEDVVKVADRPGPHRVGRRGS